MKRILFIILIVAPFVSKAQFPGTDSLRNYNNKYITNNPATAFTNLRLNTLLRGIIDWVDTARAGTGGGGAVGVDTLYALNDSTIRYRKNGVFRNVVLKGVYDARRKVDTAYAVNDTTLRITINGSVKNIILPGRGGSPQNIANASLTANGDYTQNWGQHILAFDNVYAFKVERNSSDAIFPDYNFYNYLRVDSTINQYPFRAHWSLSYADQSPDSIWGDIGATRTSSFIENVGASGYGLWNFIGNSTNPRLSGTLFGDSKISNYQLGHVTILKPADSVTLKAVPAATADSVLAVRAFNGGVNTVVKVPVSGISRNISNTSLTANGDYTQDWAEHWFLLNNLKALNFSSNRIDPNYPGNKKTFSLFSDSTAQTYPLWLKWSLRNVADNQDSLGGDLVFNKNSLQLNNYDGNAYATFYASGNQFFPNAQIFASDGSTQSVVTVGATTIFLDAHDSTRVKLVPAATADSVVALRSLGFGLNTLLKVPMPSGGSATLSNVGSGFRWVKTAGGQIKTSFAGYGIIKDSTSNTDGITDKADTSSTNHLVTQSDLNDSAAVLRAAIATGGTGEANTVTNVGSGVGLAKTKVGVDIPLKSITTPASVAATSNTNDVALQLVNDETSPSRWRFYGTDLNDSSKGFKEIEENFVGILYNKNTWANLNDFTTSMVTASVVSNKIQVAPTTAGIYSCNLAINNLLDSIAFTNLQKWKATIRVTVDVKDGTSYGFGVGMKSYNDYGRYNAIGRFAAYTGSGEIYLSGSNDSVTLNNSIRKLPFDQGDRVLLTVERDGGYITTSVRNLTTNSTTVDTSYYYHYDSGPYMPNTGKFAIWAFGGQFTVDSICISSNEVKNARLMVVGNSKMQGYLTSGYDHTVPAMLNANFKTTVLHAGGSDRTLDIARSLPEILMQRPQQVLLVDAMSNDRRQNAELAAVTYARYDSIATVLTNAGIDVYHVPLYESSIDLSAVNSHILATFPAAKVFNSYPVAQIAGALSGDGVHLTDYGNTLHYNNIIQSYKLYGGNQRYGGSGGATNISGTTNSIPKFITSTAIGNSNLSDNGTVVNSAVAFRAQGGITLQNTSSGTDEKNWNIQTASGNLSVVAVNDAGSVSNPIVNFTRVGAVPGMIQASAPLLINQTADVALDIVPIANKTGYRATGTVSGYYIPTNFSVDASGGLFGNYINTNTGSSADAEIAIGTAGGSSGSPFIAYRNSSNNFEWTTGQHMGTGDFRINSGTFPGMSGGTNVLSITSTGIFGIGTSTPVKGLHVNRSMRINKDSVARFTTTGPRQMLVQDTTTGEVQRMDIPSGSSSDLTGGAIKANIHIVSDADYTVASTDYAIIYSTMSADRTLTLPSASTNTNRVLMLKQGGAGGTHSLNLSIAIRDNAGVTTSVLGNNESVTIISDGTDWWIVTHGS